MKDPHSSRNSPCAKATDRVERRLAELDTSRCSDWLQQSATCRTRRNNLPHVVSTFKELDRLSGVMRFRSSTMRVAWNYTIAQERQIATTDERTERVRCSARGILKQFGLPKRRDQTNIEETP